MIRASQAANMPKSFIDNIKLKAHSKTHYTIENKWKKGDKPLAIFFEYGTRDHWIEPVNAQVLAWASGGPESGQKKAIYSKRADNTKGNMLFSKGHYVSGLPAYEPMTRGFKIGYTRVHEELIKWQKA